MVNNGIPSPALQSTLDNFKKELDWEVEDFSPQLGWARGRNRILKRFEDSDADVCVLADCDQYYSTNSWCEKILAYREMEPDLHAYMIRPDKYQKTGVIRLKSGALADVYPEWYGTTNVFSREVLKKVGGYNHTDFPQEWGFHDAEHGLRLKHSGLLAPIKNLYIDPIRIQGGLGHSDSYDKSMEDLKNRCIKEYSDKYAIRAMQIKAKSRLWLPYV